MAWPRLPDVDIDGDRRPLKAGHDMEADGFVGFSSFILDFGDLGVWVNYDDDPALWRRIHTAACEGLATGNIDGIWQR